MNVWYHLPTILKRRHALQIAGLITLCVAFITALLFGMVSHAAAGVNQTLSFQGRLTNSTGGIVPDGHYNIQFKIYQDGAGTAASNPGGTLKWTEGYINNGGTSGVEVKNGYFSVTLGSQTPFGTSIDWNQDTLWLSMNVAGSSTSCTTFGSAPCAADGEMLPMKRLTSTPYALNAGSLGGRTSEGFIQNATTAQTADFNITGTGIAGTIQATTTLLAPVLDRADSGTLSIGTTNATQISLDQDVSVAAGKSLTLAGGNTASRPASPTEGMLYYDSSTKQLLRWNGTKWVGDSTDAVIVAASDSSQTDKDAADYVADGNTGAANDGDQVQINSALTAASGKKVILLAGTYVADATISVPNNTTITGVGPGTVIQMADIDATDNLIENSDTTTGTGVAIQDLKLDGQDTANTAGTQYGIYLSNMGDYATGKIGSTIRNVHVSDFRTGGIYYSSSDNNKLSDASITGMSNGGTARGVYLDSSARNNIISDSTFLANSYAVSAEGSTTSNNIVTGSAFRSNGYGLVLHGATNTTATNNNFDDTANYGVYIFSDSTASAYNHIANNSFNSSGSAIVVANSSDNSISTNKIHDSGGVATNNAVVINTDSDHNAVFDNAISDSSCTTNCYAISITSTSADATRLSNNDLGTNGTINDSGTGTTYSGQLDANGKLINKSSAGTSVQTSTDSTTGFTVQNAAGTSLLTVDTANNKVLVAGTLDTTTAAGLSIGSSTATSITLGNSESNIANTLYGNTTLKSASGGNSTTLFRLQRADSTSMLVADSTNETITFGDPVSGNKTIVSTATGKITKYGTARNTKKITLNAEYTGSILDAGSGTNNSGIMTSSVDLTNRMNYYKWTTSQATNQNYDVVVQIPLPNDFDGWASSNPLSIAGYTSNTTNGTISLEARDSAGSVQCDFVSVTPSSTSTWDTNNSACTLSSGTYTPGDYITLRIRMQSPTSGDVRVGNINLSYLSKY